MATDSSHKESELQLQLREMEDDIQLQSEYMARLKSEYTANRNKLRESYWPKISPLHTTVYMSRRLQRDMETEIGWLEKKVVSMEQLKTHFIEVRDMAATKKKLFDALQPAFSDAYLSLEQVTKDDLATLRSYEHPPQAVLDTMAVVMSLRGEPEATWEDAKLLLSETYYYAFFVGKCRQAHKQEFTEAQLEALTRYLLGPDSAVEAVTSVSIPCGAIAKWLHCLHDFFFLQRLTAAAPKQLTVEQWKDIVSARRKALQDSKESVSDAHEKLKALNDELALKEKELRNRYDDTMIPLQQAFFDATHKFNDVFASPRRRREEGLLQAV